MAGRSVGRGEIGACDIAQAGFKRLHLKPYRAIARESEQASARPISLGGKCEAEQAQDQIWICAIEPLGLNRFDILKAQN